MSHTIRALSALVPSLVFLTHLSAADAIIVEAPRPSLTAPDKTAAKAEADRVPGGASVIDAESYKTGRSANFQDMLGYAPGVFIQPRFGQEEARLSIRGSGLARTFHMRGILLLSDGIPVNLADGGGDFQSTDPALTDHIEVYRGANGHRLGAATLGGAINFVSPTGRTAAPGDVRAEAGSFQYASASASGGAVSGNLDGWVGATVEQAHGYRDHAQSQAQRAQGNVGYRLTDQIENRTYLAATNSISELPGSLTRAQFEADPTQATAAAVAGDQHRDYPLVRAANKTTAVFGEHQVEAAVAYSWKHLDHPIFQVLDQVSNDGLGSLRYGWLTETNRFEVLIAQGVGLTRAKQFINVAGDSGAQTDDGYQRSTNGVLDLGDELSFGGQTHVSAGVQFNRATRRFDDYQFGGANGADRSADFSYRGASPRVGVRQELSEGVQVFASIANSFEAPSFGELVAVGTNPGLLELAPQRGTTFEVGSRGEVARAAWDLSLYYAKLVDELISYQVAPNVSRTLNADASRHAGVELGGDVIPVEDLYAGGRLRLRANYLFSWFHFQDDAQFGNNAIAGIPPHSARIEALYELNGWYGGPNTQIMGPGYVDHANTTEAPGSALLGAKVGYRVGKGVNAFIEGRNLLNQNYVATYSPVTTATANSAIYNPGDGRAVYVGAGWTF